MAFLTGWLAHYGYAVLFFALFLEMLALPLPGEVLMSYAGLLVFQGKLSWPISIVAAGLGVSAGMTVSYWIGWRLGMPFFERYGSRIHLGKDKFDNVSAWFQRYGNTLILFAFFIPGVRHITGYFSGATRLAYRKYAVFAYIGAFIWAGVFISLGKLLGPKWEQYHHTINRYLIIGGIMAATIFALVYAYRNYKNRILVKLTVTLEHAARRFRTFGRVQFIVLSAFAALIVFVSLMIGLIQDFLAGELVLFDEVASYIIHRMFGPDWRPLMNAFALLGTPLFFVPVIAATAVWIVFKGKNRALELSVFALAVAGGEALDEALRQLFHRTAPGAAGVRFPFTFPSEQTLITLTVCGFAAYLLFRHFGDLKIRAAATLSVILISLLVGVSRVYSGVQYPSDVAAGLVFGAVWLSFNVILLEILRILQDQKSGKRG